MRAQLEGHAGQGDYDDDVERIHGIVGLQSFVGNDPTIDTLNIVQQTQIIGIQPADVDPALLVVPPDAEGHQQQQQQQQ